MEASINFRPAIDRGAMAPRRIQSILDLAFAPSYSPWKEAYQPGIAPIRFPHGSREFDLGRSSPDSVLPVAKLLLDERISDLATAEIAILPIDCRKCVKQD